MQLKSINRFPKSEVARDSMDFGAKKQLVYLGICQTQDKINDILI